MAESKSEGTVVVTEGNKRYEARYKCIDDVVTIYINDDGPFTTQSGGLFPETVARMLLREFLDGRLGSDEDTSTRS